MDHSHSSHSHFHSISDQDSNKRRRISPSSSSSTTNFFNPANFSHLSRTASNGKGKEKAAFPQTRHDDDDELDSQDDARNRMRPFNIIPKDLHSISRTQRRLIIQLDIDNFYVAVVRKHHPELRNRPIGIKQKGILATISYEARQKGVDKLSSISNALRLCPELVIVNGEDLTEFRRTSNEIFRLVRGLIWNFKSRDDGKSRGTEDTDELGSGLELDSEKKVEKLGMDELWIDVTDMIDHHLFTQSSSSASRISASDPDSSNPSKASNFTSHRSSRPSESHIWFSLLPPGATPDDSAISTNLKQSSKSQDPEEESQPLDERASISTQGFWYLPNHFSGHLIPPSMVGDGDTSSNLWDGLTPNPHPYDIYLQRLSLTSQFAQYLRTLIHSKTQMTLSAGISHNKLLSKLIGGFNKPDGLSCFVPFGGMAAEELGAMDPSQDSIEDQNDAGVTLAEGESFESRKRNQISRQLIDGMEVRKLNGFGSKIVSKLKEQMEMKESLRSKKSLSEGGDDTSTDLKEGIQRTGNETNVQDKKSKDSNPNLEWISTTSTLETSSSKNSLTLVSTIRRRFTLGEFINLFNQNLGSKLYSLLFAIDPDPVCSSPLFPNQIGIEDTFRNLKGKELFKQIETLSEGLLKRLQDELIVYEDRAGPGDVDDGIKSDKKSRWLRYPLNLRLSIRLGWNNRISKQTKLFVEIFEVEKISFEKRLEKLIALVNGLLKSLLKSNVREQVMKKIMRIEDGEEDGKDQRLKSKANDEVEVEGLNLINLTATDLSKIRPSRGIGVFMNSKTSPINPASMKTDSDPLSPKSNVQPPSNQVVSGFDSVPADHLRSPSEKRLSERPHHKGNHRVLDLHPDIDFNVLDELPEEVRNQVLEQYGLLEEYLASSSSTTSSSRVSRTDSKSGVIADPVSSSSNASQSDSIMTLPSTSRLVCPQCGREMEPWLQHDHDLYPILGLPDRYLKQGSSAHQFTEEEEATQSRGCKYI